MWYFSKFPNDKSVVHKFYALSAKKVSLKWSWVKLLDASFWQSHCLKLEKLMCGQKWHLQKSASDDGVKIELRSVLAQFKANLSFPTPGMLLSGL